MRIQPVTPPPTTDAITCPHCGHPVILPAPATPTVVINTATLSATLAPVPVPVPVPVVVPDVVPVRAAVVVLLRAIVEIIAGRRQATTVAMSTAETVQRYAHAAMLRHHGQPIRIRSCHLSRPDEPVIEAVVVIEIGGRVRAMAAALQQIPGGGWFCYTLRIV